MTSDLHHRLSWMSMRLGPSAGLVRARRYQRLSRVHAAPGDGCFIAVAPVPMHIRWHTGAARLRALVVRPLPESP